MYRLTVGDRVMIAHSFKGEIFGPAQGSWGHIRRLSFAPALDEYNLVVDIGLAHQALAGILKPSTTNSLTNFHCRAEHHHRVWHQYLGGMAARLGGPQINSTT